MMKLSRTLLLASSLLCFPAWADKPSDRGEIDLPEDSRIKLLPYSEDDVFTVTTRYGYQTSIVFSPREQIETVSVGDRSLWQIIPSGNRMFIRPMEEGVTTNMTVLTNRHSYQFDLKSLAADKDSGNIYVAKFVYEEPEPVVRPAYAYAPPPGAAPAFAPASPPAPAPAPAQLPAASAPTTSPMLPINPNYNYTYAGPDMLAPEQVYDDGKSTFIRFRSLSTPPPGLSIVDSRGQEMPASYTIKGDTLILDGVVGELAIRQPSGKVTVYNEMLNPAKNM